MADGSRLDSRPPWWPRWYELTPEALLGLGLTVFLLDEPDAATSAFDSGHAIRLMALVAVGWLLARVVLHRWFPWRAIRVLPFVGGTVVILALVVAPAYDDDTVVETFPGAAADAAPADGAPSPPSPETAGDATPMPLFSGVLQGIDHRAEGTVTVYRRPGGRFVVGLEEIDIQPGPDYDVYVVPGADREDRDGGVRLDDLRGNRGTQFYDVPGGIDLEDGEWTVLVWCQTFAVPIANATPA